MATPGKYSDLPRSVAGRTPEERAAAAAAIRRVREDLGPTRSRDRRPRQRDRRDHASPPLDLPVRAPRRKRPARSSLVRMRQRRRRTAVLLLLVIGLGLVLADLLSGDDPETTAPSQAPAVNAPGAGPALSDVAAGRYAETGSGAFSTARGPGPILGTAGAIRPFHVVAEVGTNIDVAGFATAIDTILGDPRSWVASRQFRLQRVAETVRAEFIIYLATPGTAEKLCAVGGLYTDRYTSCRLVGQVIINVARWLDAIPNYGAPLSAYRAYAINHEVGHQFGEGHEACPAPGGLAPVMQQQTYGLKGCLPNAWPYVEGKRYAGPPET